MASPSGETIRRPLVAIRDALLPESYTRPGRTRKPKRNPAEGQRWPLANGNLDAWSVYGLGKPRKCPSCSQSSRRFYLLPPEAVFSILSPSLVSRTEKHARFHPIPRDHRWYLRSRTARLANEGRPSPFGQSRH